MFILVSFPDVLDLMANVISKAGDVEFQKNNVYPSANDLIKSNMGYFKETDITGAEHLCTYATVGVDLPTLIYDGVECKGMPFQYHEVYKTEGDRGTWPNGTWRPRPRA